MATKKWRESDFGKCRQYTLQRPWGSQILLKSPYHRFQDKCAVPFYTEIQDAGKVIFAKSRQ